MVVVVITVAASGSGDVLVIIVLVPIDSQLCGVAHDGDVDILL